MNVKINIFFISITIFFRPTYGQEREKINKNIIDCMEKKQLSLNKKFHCSEKIELLRNQWVYNLRENFDLIERETCLKIIGFYNDCKMYHLALNKEPYNFISDEMFEEILPLLCEKIDFSYLPTFRSSFGTFIFSNPHLLNNLMYDKNMNFTKENLKTKTIEAALSGIVSVINLFKSEEKKIVPLKRVPLFFDIPFTIEKVGFFIGETLYKGKFLTTRFYKNHFPDFDPNNRGIDQNVNDRINYIKTIFYPHSYKKIDIKDFTKHVKESFCTFLLCIKKEYPRIKIPKYVMWDIASYFEKLVAAQKIRPQLETLVGQLNQLRKIKYADTINKNASYLVSDNDSYRVNEVIDFMCDDLLTWFDQESLR